MKKPTVFISYAWEDDVTNWAIDFTKRLENDGIEIHIDQKDLQLGDRLPLFMEKIITEVDYVLIICTPLYKKKADSRTGGVGYEGHIISASLMNNSNERKFIPILHKGTFDESFPNFLLGKYSANLSLNNPHYEEEYQKLIATLLGKKLKLPRKAKNNIQSSKKVPSIVKSENNSNEPIHILRIITEEVTTPKMDGTPGSALYKIPFKLSRQPNKLWIDLFVQTWNSPPSYTAMHRPGIASVVGDTIILDGTTIEEVQKYHSDTLKLCIDVANKKEQEISEQIQNKKLLEQQKQEQHINNVVKFANSIQW